MSVNEKMTAIADAIRAKTGGTTSLTLDGMAQAIAGIQAEGNGEVSAAQLTAMRIMSRLETGALNLDEAWGIHGKTIPHNYAYGNLCITALYWSEASGGLAIGNRAFWGCEALKSIDFPNLTYWHYANVFNGCKSLTNVRIPKFSGTLAISSFANCTSLSDIYMPGVTSLSSSVFSGCTSLTITDWPMVTNISNNSFNGSGLKTLILRNDSVVTLAAVNAFDKTIFAIGGTGGTVYVPESLIPEYQQATNWSTLYAAGTCQFVAIEGSEYE